ncbi:MAG: fibronectin type III domain-containing protein, partial [Bacteroidetes bacterium]|nr:fibronectin type III domain-containing protein [Bacteroidota bacterium]
MSFLKNKSTVEEYGNKLNISKKAFLFNILIFLVSYIGYGQNNFSVNNDGADDICASAWPAEILGNYYQNGTNNGKACYEGPDGYWLYHANMSAGIGASWVVGKPLGSTDINGANVRHYKPSTASTPPLNTRFISTPNGCGYIKISDAGAIPPSAPTLNSPYSVGSTSMNLSWSQSPGATGYHVYVSTNNIFTALVSGLDPKDVPKSAEDPYAPTSTTISGLSQGTKYYIRVRAYSGAGESGNSNAVSATTSPSAPVSEAPTNITDISFNANWNTSAGATYYLLYVSTNIDFSSYISGYNGKNVGDVTIYNVNELSANSNYYYRIKAYNSSGGSAYSGTKSLTTSPPSPITIAADGITSNSFTANWNSSSQATRYYIDVSLASNFNENITGFDNRDVGNVLTYNISGLNSGTTYYFRVRASNAIGTSSNSDSKNLLTIPGTSTANSATTIRRTSFYANWSSMTGATGYKLDIATDADFNSKVSGYNDLDIGDVTTYLVNTNITANTSYFYRIRAYNASGTGSYSNTISLTTAHDPPTIQSSSIVFTNVELTQLKIDWTSGNGSNRTVFLYEGNSGNAAPVDNTTYTANTKFKSGTQIAATGWYCVYNGAGTSVNITGLMPGATYRAMVCEYNGTPSYEAYNTSAASGNPANQAMKTIMINEVDADTPGTDELEFVELFDGGTGNVSLDGLVLVFYNGSDNQSYNVGGHLNGIDLDGYSTDANGYFVIGNSGVSGVNITFNNDQLQNGADAVALFIGNGIDFPDNTILTTTNLIDAFVYDTDDVDDAELLQLINGGEPQVNENGRGNKDNHSNQRIPSGSGGLRNTSSYTQQPPTPDAANYAYPEITSATYDFSTNQLVVTGKYLASNAGGNNDVDVSLLTIRGEGGNTYTLSTTSDVEISSATQFGITLTGSDIINIEALLNKDGTTSATNLTTYNLAAADNWLTGAPAGNNIADATNGITVSNFANPAITSSTYDVSTGQLVATGTNFVLKSGAANDVDASLFTFTGQAGGTYILTNTSDVEITSATEFTLILSAGDKLNVDGLLNKNGTSSAGGTTYNLAAADNWMTGSPAANNISDATTGITVSNVPVPTISSATYDYTTNVLVVTGVGLVANAGAANDVDISKLTITGDGGGTYTITSTTDVELTSATEFSVTLSGTDLTNVEALLNKNGTSSADATTYNLAAAEDWLTGADAAENIADLNGNGITVSNYANPAITSATYDVSTGLLVATGTNFVNKSGVTNDIDASLLTIKGEGDNTYQLTDTPDVEITSATAFTLTLSATDKLNVHGLLNKNGLQSADAIVYNLAAADNWMQASPSANDIADATNGITVSNVQTPTITSATYDSDIGIFVVTGTNLFKKPGTANDIDVSKFTVTGEGGTYTITSATDVEITSSTEFTFTVTGADKTQIDAKLDLFGTQSSGGTVYNLAAAEDWLAGADPSANIADLAGNAITVSVTPKITSATYNAATGVMVVTGTNIQANGGGADIDASKFTITGEGGDNYTLTNTPDVERTSATQFTLTLSATDRNAVAQIINKNGTTSTSGTTYNVAAADDWCTNVTTGNTADLTGNGITASNVPVPTITSATYNASTGVFVVTGAGLVNKSGALNDIDISKFTVTGEGGDTHTFANTTDVEITSGTQFTFTLNAEDKNTVNLIINKNGTSSTSGTTYNLAAAEDWAAGADAAVNVVDAVGNGITSSNVPVPVIISASYHWSNGILTATGTGFVKKAGAANDIDASKYTFRGEGGATYTLVGSADVEITSGTEFAITLDATDKAAVNIIINKPGTQSNDNTVYNLAAAEDWAQGADAAVNVVDAITPITAGNFNNSPTGGNDNVNTYENANYTFKDADFTYNDIDSDVFAGIRIETIETAGELKYNNVDVTAGLNCTDVSKLVFIPQSNTLGSPYATFTFKVKDFRGAYSDAAYTMTISVLPEFISGIISEHQNLCYNVVPARLISTTPTGGVAPYAYQWQSSTNGVNFTNIVGETTLEYQPPVLAQSAYYRILQTPTCCGTIATNIVKITVHGEFIAGSISESQVLYYRTTPEKFIGVAPTGGKTPYSYQWQSSFDGSNFTDVYGATSLDYQAGGASNTTYFRLKQSSASGCGTVFTDKLTMVVFPEFEVGSIKEDQHIAYNTIPEKLNGKEPRGGWSPYSYQWQSSTDKTNFINISGATNLDYQPSV